MSHTGRGWFTPAAAAAAVLLGVYLAGTGAVYFRPDGSSVAFWWPAAGLSVALVASMPRSWAPGLAVAVAVVSAAANLTGGQTVEISLVYGVANAVEAIIAGLALKDASGHLVRLTQLSDFVRLLVAALAGALALGLIAASGGGAARRGRVPPDAAQPGRLPRRRHHGDRAGGDGAGATAPDPRAGPSTPPR